VVSRIKQTVRGLDLRNRGKKGSGAEHVGVRGGRSTEKERGIKPRDSTDAVGYGNQRI